MLKIEAVPGDRLEIDCREIYTGDPYWVPCIFIKHVEATYHEPLMHVKIDAPEGHDWHAHNGILFQASASPAWVRKV